MLPAWFLTGSMWRDCLQQGHSPALPIHPTLGTERIPTCAVRGQGGLTMQWSHFCTGGQSDVSGLQLMCRSSVSWQLSVIDLLS